MDRCRRPSGGAEAPRCSENTGGLRSGDSDDLPELGHAQRTAAHIVRLLPIGVMTFRFDPPSELVLADANEMAVAMVLGRAPSRPGMRFEELWPPRMAEKVKPAVLATAQGGSPYENEVVLRDDGDVRHAFRMRAFAIPDQRVVIAFEEITEQRRAEESLAQSEAKYRSLVEDLADVVYAADANGVLTYISPAVTALLGYAPSEIIGRPYLDFAPSGALPTMSDLETTSARPPHEGPTELALTTRGGDTVWVRASGHLLYDSRGAVVGLRGVLNDVTLRREADEVLARARRDKDLILDATSDCLAYYAPDSTVRWVNRAAAEAIGLDERDIVGKPCEKVWHCRKRENSGCAVHRVMETRRPSEFRMQGRGGRTYVVRAYPAFERDRLVGVVESIVDITASQRAREEREQMEAQLRQSQKLESIGTLASGIAHEVNNPLMGMINYAELIASRVEEPRLREFADGIREEGARVAAIVRNLLSFARKDAGEPTDVDAARLVEITLSLFRALLERDGIAVDVDMPSGLPPIRCRSQEIEQVLLNLLTNARDALNERFPGGGPEKRLAVRARSVSMDQGAFVRLSVEDNGSGIPESIRDRVFDPFFTTKPRDRGTGLGLSISYGIVRDHGGRLWIEPLPASRGATAVHVDLPSIGAAAQ